MIYTSLAGRALLAVKRRETVLHCAMLLHGFCGAAGVSYCKCNSK